jgi:hypothetical protein
MKGAMDSVRATDWDAIEKNLDWSDVGTAGTRTSRGTTCATLQSQLALEYD